MKKRFYVRKLLFSLVTDPILVEKATGWKFRECDIQEGLETPALFLDREAFLKEADYIGTWYGFADHTAVHLIYDLLDALDIETLANKAKKIEFKNNHCTPFLAKNIPNVISYDSTVYWARKPGWSIDEATWLSMGFIYSDKFSEYLKDHLKFQMDYFPILKEFFIRKSLLQSALENGHIGKTNNSLHFLDWLKKIKLSLPDNLRATICEYQQSDADTFLRNQEEANPRKLETINPKARTSMLMLIHAMASEKYLFQHGKTLGPAKKAVQRAMIKAELKISNKVIGQYLKEAQQESERQKDKNR